MKTNFVSRWSNSLAVGVFLLAGLLVSQKATAESYNDVSFQIFYDELAPYGDWVRDSRHGYIWLPAVDQSFHPYGTEGHWVMTEFGNTWVSYYDWGWAPFHYGRWYFDDYFQSWAWIPGYKWGPAWVNWRTGGGYYGWAPLGPGISINVRVNLPAFHWVFLPRHRIYHHYAYQYYAPHRTRVRIYNNTTVINNTYVYNNQTYVTGPSRRELQQVTRSNVPVYQVRNTDAPGRASVSRNALNLYRPEIQNTRGTSVSSRPSRVLEAEQAKSVRGSRELNATTTSRNSSVGSSSTGRTAPSLTTSPSVNEGPQRPKVTPMPNDSRNRSTSPAQVQSPQTPQTPPARSTEVRPSPNSGQRTTIPSSRSSSEVKRTETRTQQPAPNRGSVHQSRPAQTPRSQAPQMRSSQPSRSQVSQPARSPQSRSSSPQVKSSAPARQSAPATQSRSSSTTGRSGGRGN